MEFLYKTRGSSSPEGKSRICVLGHPDDFPLYFETLSNQILEWYNCSIWYTFDEIDSLDEDSHFYISQMQLVIVMATKRLFTERQFTVQAAQSLAEVLHIPFLPIVYEAGIDDLYAHYYQNLHYISPVTNDTYATDISFEQKLQRFLNNILITDDDIVEIKQAFDASIFISYRKKDREHALQLMKRIHKHEPFRTVAIWYDEFLIPGDNFLNDINEKLQSCDLFAMVVTPNLLEPDNFVMNVEYKEACSADKLIFPVEMVTTDKSQLQQSFHALPPCISFNNDDDLDHKLNDYLSNALPPFEEMNGKKAYYLGLAYLNGINTEVNPAIALSLLTKAASFGHVEAYEQLIIMYRDGKCIPRDIQQALEIQDILVSKLFDLYCNYPNNLVRNKLHYHLFEIIEAYEKNDFVEKTEKYIHMMTHLIDTAGEDSLSDSPENKTMLGMYTNYLMKYAALNRQKGQFDIARDCYDKCATIRYRLIQFSENSDEQLVRMRAVSATYLELGDMELNQLDNFEAAEHCYSYTKYLRETIVATCPKGHTAELGYRRDLANVIWRLANLMFEKALKTRNDVVSLVHSSNQLFQECLAMRLKLVEEAKTEQAEDEVATVYLGLAKLFLYFHRLLSADMKIAYTYVQNALSIAERIMASQKTRHSIKRVARMLEINASTLMNLQDPEGAFHALKNAQELLEEVVTQYQSADDIFILAGLYEDAGKLFQMMHQINFAVVYHEKALHQLEILVQTFPNNPAYQKAYSETLAILHTLNA